MDITTVNPATEEPLASYSFLTDRQVDEKIEAAVRAHHTLRALRVEERAQLAVNLANVVATRRDTLAALMTREMGKPIVQAEAELDKCVRLCRYYAENAEEMLKVEDRESEASRSYVSHEPLGVVLAIMPWNFPFWQVFRFAVPALLAGNAGLLKHAENVQGCAEAIEALFVEAGFPDGSLTNILIETDEVAAVIRDSRVRAVTLTGSGRAGRSVARAAGDALKPSLLELGGSDAFIVLADADLDHAVEVGVRSRMQNNGQSCIAAKRFIVEAGIAERFTSLFVDRVKCLQLGDPFDRKTDVGPLARADLREALAAQVDAAVSTGANVLTGGSTQSGHGFYYQPTVLAEVDRGSSAFDEEMFGPVAAMTVAHGIDHATDLANATRFGLGAAIFTRDVERTKSLVDCLEAGSVFINAMVQSHPNLPFGGIKESGYGRELGVDGIRSFTNKKTVWIH
jgi:acyl-CoA reductase-like NAD-dependent aldehyde dehydrogenase